MSAELKASEMERAEKNLIDKGCKKKIGDLWDVPIAVLKIDQNYCFRRSRNLKVLNYMARDIGKKGILNVPTAIYSLEADELVLAVGFGRVACLKINKKDYVPCRVFINRKIVPQEIFNLILSDNLHREDMKPVELALFFRTWMRETGMSQKELAEKIHRSETYLSEIIGPLKTLSEEEIEKILTSELSRSQIMELAKIEDRNKRMELIDKGASVREIRELAGRQKNEAKETDPNIFRISDEKAKTRLGDAVLHVMIKFPNAAWRNEDVIELLAGIIEKLREPCEENSHLSIDKFNF